MPLLAAEQVSFPVLPALIVVPLLTVLALLFVPRHRADYLKAVALLGTTITGAISVQMLASFDVDDPGFQFVSRATWVEDLGISFFLGVDGISLFLVVLSGILYPIAILATEPHHDAKPYYAWLVLLQAGSMGVFMALDLLLFFLFFEVVLVPMYFLIGGWGHGNRVYASMKFFIYTMAASALMLVGILAVVFLTAAETGVTTFDVTQLAGASALSDTAAMLVFLSFALAFSVKVPLFPLHTWLPDAHTEAPTAGSIILAGVMLKLGTYGFIRFGLYLFPEAAWNVRWLFITLGVIGIVYGAVVATMQTDLKRLVAYSSVAHLGFIVLGTFAFNPQGIEGGILVMVNHGISTGALFILVGWIYERRHTRQISELSGMQKSAPIMAGAFTFVMLSSIGLPGLNGFVGEFLVLLGAFNANRYAAVIATTGVILAALYLLWAYQRTFHGTPTDTDLEMKDMTMAEGLSLIPLLGLIVFLGVYPKPMIDRMEPAVEALVAHVDAHVADFSDTEPDGPAERTDAETLTDALHEAEEKKEGK